MLWCVGHNLDHVIRGGRVADVFDAVQIAGGLQQDRPLAEALRMAVDLGFERAFFDDDQFVVGLWLRGVGCRAWIDGCGVAIQFGECCGRAVEKEATLAGICRLRLELGPVVDRGF